MLGCAHITRVVDDPSECGRHSHAGDVKQEPASPLPLPDVSFPSTHPTPAISMLLGIERWPSEKCESFSNGTITKLTSSADATTISATKNHSFTDRDKISIPKVKSRVFAALWPFFAPFGRSDREIRDLLWPFACLIQSFLAKNSSLKASLLRTSLGHGIACWVGYGVGHGVGQWKRGWVKMNKSKKWKWNFETGIFCFVFHF